MDDDEKSLREIKGERCWEKRARREEMMGILLKARIMSGKTKERTRRFEYGLDFDSVAFMCNYHDLKTAGVWTEDLLKMLNTEG